MQEVWQIIEGGVQTAVHIWRWLASIEPRAWTALATWVAAVLVGAYAWQTWRLRQIAQEQVEALIAPVLLLAQEPPKPFPAIRMMDFAGLGNPCVSFAIYNAGKGVALRGRLRTKITMCEQLEALGLSSSSTPPQEYELSPIPAGTSVRVVLPARSLAHSKSQSGEVDTDTMWMDFDVQMEFDAQYESASGQSYGTYVKSKWNDLDGATLIEYTRRDPRSGKRRRRSL